MIPATKIILINILLFWSAWIISARVLRLREGIDRLLGTFISGFLLVVLLLEFLSAFGSINFETVALSFVGILAILLFYSGRTAGIPENAREDNSEHKKFLGVGFFLFLLCFGIIFLMNTTFALLTPPAPTDAFLDHLVFPAEWLREGRITLVQTLSPDQATTYYPSNAELLYLWLMLPLHNDLAVGILEPLCLVVAMLACVRIGRRIWPDARWTTGAAALAAVAPGVMGMTNMFGVDLFFTASILCSAAFLLPDKKGRITISEIVLAGVAGGLAAGTKYVGVMSLFLILPLLFAGRTERSRITTILCFFVSAIAACGFWYIRNLVVTGSTFYPLGLTIAGLHLMPGAFDRSAMFNAYLHIPIYNIEYFCRLFSTHLFGLWLLTGATLLFSYSALRRSGITGRLLLLILSIVVLAGVTEARIESWDFGVWSAALLAAGIIFFMLLIHVLFHDSAWWTRYTIGLSGLFVFAFWFLNPYNTANNHRFLAPAVFILCLLVVNTIERSKWAWSWWILTICAVAVNLRNLSLKMNFLSNAMENFTKDSWYSEGLTTAFPAALAVICAFATLVLLIRRKHISAAVCGALFTIFFAAFVSFKSDYISEGRYRWYASHYLGPGWAKIGKITQPVTIAYAGNCSPYGLYGNKFKNRVVYINPDGNTRPLFHEYELKWRKNDKYIRPLESVGLNYVFRSITDYDKWLMGLSSEEVDILFVSLEFYRGIVSKPIELVWASEHPEDFRLISKNRDASIFEVIKQAKR